MYTHIIICIAYPLCMYELVSGAAIRMYLDFRTRVRCVQTAYRLENHFLI